MKIKEIMSRQAVDPTDLTITVADVTRKMREEDAGCLLVGRYNWLWRNFGAGGCMLELETIRGVLH